MKDDFNKYKSKAKDYIKENKYDEQAKDMYGRGKDYFEEKGGKEGLINYFKTIFKRFHHGETTAILIVSGVIIFFSSIWAHDNVHRHGIGPSFSDTNKEKREYMERQSEIYDWD